MKIIKWLKEQYEKPRPYKPTRQEEAILELADYLENPNHDQYKIKKHIADILGITFTQPHNHKQ